MPLFLLTVFGKGEKANLSKAERNKLARPGSQNFYSGIMVATMTSAFSSIKQGLTEAIGFTEGEIKKAVIHEFSAVDVKGIRAKAGMSQTEFALAFGINVSTLRHWERGDRTPQGPALVLLNVVAKEPDVVLRALHHEC